MMSDNTGVSQDYIEALKNGVSIKAMNATVYLIENRLYMVIEKLGGKYTITLASVDFFNTPYQIYKVTSKASLYNLVFNYGQIPYYGEVSGGSTYLFTKKIDHIYYISYNKENSRVPIDRDVYYFKKYDVVLIYNRNFVTGVKLGRSDYYPAYHTTRWNICSRFSLSSPSFKGDFKIGICDKYGRVDEELSISGGKSYNLYLRYDVASAFYGNKFKVLNPEANADSLYVYSFYTRELPNWVIPEYRGSVPVGDFFRVYVYDNKEVYIGYFLINPKISYVSILSDMGEVSKNPDGSYTVISNNQGSKIVKKIVSEVGVI